MPLSPGTRLGPYEIVAPLGAGGMGEVYRARDTRLAREVAVKVLPEHLSSNAEVRQRFEREAKTVSSLNHPNICTLFDVGREGDKDYLVMELVEGETLAHRLEKGALPVADALRYGAQIADALDRAHRAGVIHRDLKPGNVMLTRAGVKLLDFGLARAIGLGAMPGSGAGASVATIAPSPHASAPLTAEGTIVGTFQYMSPEQLEGKEADARSDIWAFGCVLYEMATGKRAFDGPSQASLIAAILKESPRPMPEVAPLAPAALERVVLTCLEKHPDDRWQSAGDLKRELEWIRGSSSVSGTPAVSSAGAPAIRRRANRGVIGILAGGAIAALALAYAFGPWAPWRAEPRLMRFTIMLPPGMLPAYPAEAELSPDGTSIVYLVTDSTGVSFLCRRALASPEAQILPGTDHAFLPFWSPDSRMIGFFSNGKLRKMALDGTPPLVLCDAPDARGGCWGKDGVILFAPNNQGPIARVSDNGGAATPVTTVDRAKKEFGHRYPRFLPDGKHFLYVAVSANPELVTYVGDLDGGKPVAVCTAGSGARYAPEGYLLFLDSGVQSQHRRLLAKRFDAGSLKASGDAMLVIDEVDANNFGYPNVTLDDRGTLVVQHYPIPRATLRWRDRSGGDAGLVAANLATTTASLSPDSRRLAYGCLVPQDLHVIDLGARVTTRLTFENREVTNILWSNDGSRLYYSRLTGAGGWKIYTKAANGTGPDSLVFDGPGLFANVQTLSRDGEWMVAQVSDSTGNYDLWKIPLRGQGRPEPYQVTPDNEIGSSLSPDGHWLAYTTVEGAKTALYVQSFPQPGSKYQVAVDDAGGAAWSDRGDELLVGTQKSDVVLVPVNTAAGFAQGTPRKLFTLPPGAFWIDTARGEQKFLCATIDSPASESTLEIVLGWPKLLGKK